MLVTMHLEGIISARNNLPSTEKAGDVSCVLS